MNDIIVIIGIACFAVLFSEASGVMDKLKWMLDWSDANAAGYKFPRRMKPFDCPMCLAWWIGLAWFGWHTWSNPAGYPAAILCGATCSILAIWISKQIRV